MQSLSPFDSFLRYLSQLNWLLIGLLGPLGMISFTVLFCAAGGHVAPWALPQLVRFLVGLSLMVCLSITPIQFWFRYAYVFYALSILLLIAVEMMGTIGMGAQRWIDLFVFRLQPSELVKLTLIIALARYYHNTTLNQTQTWFFHLPVALLCLIPALLVLKQPDLGTALLLIMTTSMLIFITGIGRWKVIILLLSTFTMMPIGWHFLRTYQKERILTFLDPERDPLGSGYHILQSKIAFGSGGIWGRGLLQGSQSQLQFLPEKHTDFIFAMLSEELGLVGGVILLLLYSLLIFYGFMVSLHCQNTFGKCLAFGITSILFLYVFINMAMVMGLLPVVGIPLPLVSYGGTSMLTLLAGFGLLLCVDRHRHLRRGLSSF